MKINKKRIGAVICVLLLSVVAQNVFAQTFHIGLLRQGSIANADENIAFFVAEHPGITWEPIDDNTVLNAMTVAELIATYDLLVVPWQINSSANLDWNTRILPYMVAGGSVLWEDPTNILDIAASGVSLASGNSYTSSDISLVPPFDSNGAVGYFHIHFSITGHDGAWTPFSTDVNGGIHGVVGEFGAGRMLIGVSDNLYHPNMSLTDTASVANYNLLVNEINWLGSGSVDTDPRADAPSPEVYIPVPTLSQWGYIVLFVLLGLVGVTRLRRIKN
jgi:hypothetical protein